MSKDKGSMSRKRFCKKAAARFNIQVREVHDAVYRCQMNPEKCRKERGATEKHLAEKHLAEKREAGLQ